MDETVFGDVQIDDRWDQNKCNKICCVPDCHNRVGHYISLYKFPENPLLRKIWSRKLRIGRRLPRFSYICSQHFHRDDFVLSIYPTYMKKKLKKTAIPSQNIPRIPIDRSPSIEKYLRRCQSLKIYEQYNERVQEEVVQEPVSPSNIIEEMAPAEEVDLTVWEAAGILTSFHNRSYFNYSNNPSNNFTAESNELSTQNNDNTAFNGIIVKAVGTGVIQEKVIVKAVETTVIQEAPKACTIHDAIIELESIFEDKEGAASKNPSTNLEEGTGNYWKDLASYILELLVVEPWRNTRKVLSWFFGLVFGVLPEIITWYFLIFGFFFGIWAIGSFITGVLVYQKEGKKNHLLAQTLVISSMMFMFTSFGMAAGGIFGMFKRCERKRYEKQVVELSSVDIPDATEKTTQTEED